MELFDLTNINCDRYVSVLVDCIGIDDLLTYRVPEDVEVQVGDILSVPLGNRHVGAIGQSNLCLLDPRPFSGHFP